MSSKSLREGTPFAKQALAKAEVVRFEGVSENQPVTPNRNKGRLSNRRSTPYSRSALVASDESLLLDRLATAERFQAFQLKLATPVKLVPACADPVPGSVRRFMAEKAERLLAAKPSDKRKVAAVVVAPNPPRRPSLPSPVRRAVLAVSERQEAWRASLLDRLEASGADTAKYQDWAVHELEERVEALEVEAERAELDACLAGLKVCPRDFSDWSNAAVARWAQQEVDERQRKGPLRFPAFAGARMDFPASPHVAHVPRVAEAKSAAGAKPVDVSKLTVEALRLELRKRELKVGGLKSVLVERLQVALAEEQRQ
jgi:hypothetical protein